MSELRFSERFAASVERIFEFVAQRDPARAAAAVELVLDGLRLLERHPQIGRRVDTQLRELVIGKGAACFVALYAYDAAADVVTVITVRHAREAGWRD